MPIKRLSLTANHYAGHYDPTSGSQNLKNEDVPVSENMRVSSIGGRSMRLGATKKITGGDGFPILSIGSFPMHDVLFYHAYGSVQQVADVDTDQFSQLAIYVANSTSQGYFHPYGKQMFFVSPDHPFSRIVVSKLAADCLTAAVTATVRAGDGSIFAVTSGDNPSTLNFINGDVTSITGISGDDLTIDASGNDHFSGEIVSQTFQPSGAPKGTCISDLEGSLLVGGNPNNPKIIYFSAAETAANPEYIYDFSANGAGSHQMPSDVTALFKGTGVVLIGMKRGISYAYGFDADSGGLRTRDLTYEHGVPNAYCITQLGPRYYVFTGKRVLPVVVDAGAAAIVDDPTNPFAAFDYRVRGELDQADADQSSSFIHADPTANELHVTYFVNGLSRTLVWDGDTGKWVSKDNTNYSCKTMHLGRCYAGSNSDERIYLTNDGLTDDGVPVASRMLTKTFSIPGASSTFRKFSFSGFLSPTGQFTLRVYIDGVFDFERVITAEDMIAAGLMSTTSGRPIGSGTIGAVTVGSGGNTASIYAFTYPITLKHRAKDMQIEFEVTEEGSFLEITESRLDLETSGNLLLTSQ